MGTTGNEIVTVIYKQFKIQQTVTIILYTVLKYAITNLVNYVSSA